MAAAARSALTPRPSAADSYLTPAPEMRRL